MFFRKKPWNDLSKYYVEVSRNGSYQPFFHVMATKGREDIALNQEDPYFKCITIAEAIKLAKKLKGKTTLTIMPEFMDSRTYVWFMQHCPSKLWQFYAIARYRPFN